jgi:Domain of unknown function (DUF4338)
MSTVLTYRGRNVSTDDVTFIGQLIVGDPKTNRRALSLRLCREWNWVQPNGVPRDGVCRQLLLALHRAGHITLPPSKRPNWSSRPQPSRRKATATIQVTSEPVVARLSEIGPVEIRQVRRTSEETLVDSLVEQHHYLGYVRPVGEHLKYLVSASGRPIGCFCWSSAPLRLRLRDEYIGWSTATREANLRLVAYQTRFLILPWVRVPHLASHLLGRMARQLSADWERVYAHPIYFTQTFVDPSRYRGTCYRAANWTYLGMTMGRGNNAPTMKQTRPKKGLYVYPLVRDFRRRLGGAK